MKEIQTLGFLALQLLLGILATTSAADEKELRLKVAEKLESIVNKLDVSSTQRAKVKAFLSETQWKQAVKGFETSRGTEIHDHAHKIVPKTIPGMMQKFMPGYMRGKIMASRKKGRRGPPSRDEIAQIQQDARNKIQPVMRKAIMPALDKLKEDRVGELLRDEKTMTRMVADRIIKAEVLGKTGTIQFQKQLEKAGYPASLTSGGDTVLDDRTKKMLKELNLAEIVKAAGL